MTRALQRGLFDELVIDNFAGGGGASHGIEQAIGRPIDVAINHNPEALAMHRANHPYTRHLCEDVWAVDPIEVVAGRPVGLAWFSPDCKHFSKAKGGKPVSLKIRALAWVAIKWARKVRPRVIMLENVEEFQDWGPLVPECDKNGRKKLDLNGEPILKPCGVNKGATFYEWVHRLEDLGYQVEWQELIACDYGAPTSRKRLFLVARCDGLPIVWPEQTHGKGLKPYKTAADCIDWSIPVRSIFLTSEEAKTLNVRRPLAENTMKRIAKGVVKYVINNPKPFVITYYGPKHEGDFRGFGLDEQVRTQTTENRFALVAPYVVPIANYNGSIVAHPADEPLRTITAWPKGGSFSLVVPHIQRQFGNSVGHDIDSPLGTITAGGGGKSALITSHMIKLRGTCKDGQKITEPMPTITAGGLHLGEVRCFVVKYYGRATGQDIRKPLHTVTTNDRMGLISVDSFSPPLTDDQRYKAWMIARMVESQDPEKSKEIIPGPRPSAIWVAGGILVDIGMRMFAPRELFLAQGFPGSYVIDPEFNGKPMTKTAQVQMCGNSVSPYPVRALVEANVKLKCQTLAA